MDSRISLKMVGVIAGAAAVFAFLFGLIISSSLPGTGFRKEAVAQTTPLTLAGDFGDSPFVKVVEIVSPAVVNISAEKVVNRSPGFGWEFGSPFDDFFRDFFPRMPDTQQRSQTLGSGFIISEDGYIITNYHVVRDAQDIVVKLTSKQEFKNGAVKVVGYDSRTDIALLKVQSKDPLPIVKLGDSDKMRVGDWAIAVGNPFHLEGTVTVGVISAKGRSNIPLPEGPDFQHFLQTDAAINPGNSGGPLVNIRGEVIGINSAITSPSGGNVGIGFAIPINLARTIIEELRTKGKVTRGYLGVYLQEVTEDLKSALDLPSLEGVLVSEVMANTPADKAGLKNGDVIVEFNGEKVTDVQTFRLMVAGTPVGKKVNLKVVREGRTMGLTVTIGDAPEQATAEAGEEQGGTLGLTVVEVTDAAASRLGVNASRGAAVIAVEPGSPAADAGITPGDVIVAIGKTAIKNVAEYAKAVRGLTKGKPVIFQVQHEDRRRYVAITP